MKMGEWFLNKKHWFQSHASLCSFQQATKFAPRLRPLPLKNFSRWGLTDVSVFVGGGNKICQCF